ncbi:ATP-binding protein [Sulfitobacter dubius]|uniref:histidine kinase n=1 Tax=Sulfitobacter dubius TaxID=218673 RepID=A0ABY3ZPP4_9RHOB|nr:ATP-binding protein [Sulfitobacter dubius]UOA16608.1 Autoinducer 2 sensor kinase/phosphatase LuxQ [Sulfitobacter dubius]
MTLNCNVSANFSASESIELDPSLSERDARFDKLTNIASLVMKAPISLLTIIDDAGGQQLFKSAAGLTGELFQTRSTPLSHSFCKHVRDSGKPLVVRDSRKHPELKYNPAVAEFALIGYLGVPFRSERGDVVGAFCCIDHRPRDWDENDIEILTRLASIAADQLHLTSAEDGRVKAKRLAEQAAATRASFLSHANHEVRTPLSSIGGATRLLSMVVADEKARNLVGVIERNVSRLSALADDLVRIAELDDATASIAQESFNLSEVIGNIVDRHHDAAQTKGIDLTLTCDLKDDPLLLFDAQVLTQVVERLLSNAVKFTSLGEVRVAIASEHCKDGVTIRITDTGCGIEAEHLARLFDEFEAHNPRTARQGGGTGLGMSIVRRDVERMGGEISVSSQPGEGTDFIVFLPNGRGANSCEHLEDEQEGGSHLLTCLECGEEMGLLRRHLSQVHGLTPEAYRAKWKLASDFAVSSKGYRKMRQAVRNLM